MALLSSLLISIGSFQNSYEGIFNTFTKGLVQILLLAWGQELSDETATMRRCDILFFK